MIPKPTLFIIGGGVGDERLLTTQASQIMQSARRLLSMGRLSRLDPRAKSVSLNEMMVELQTPVEGITVVLVSGDCGFFSVANRIVRELSQAYEIQLINGIGSVQYLSAKIAVPYDDALLISLHGRNESIVPRVAYHQKVFALTGGLHKAHDICRVLDESGLGSVRVVVGESLSYPNERIVHGTAKTLQNEVFDDLTVIYIEHAAACLPSLPIRDVDFIRGDVPMTKEEVRWVSLQQLAIRPSDVLFDVGAGTGSVSVEMARRAVEGNVYAIETNDEACRLIEQNRIKHGAYNVIVVQGDAPNCFSTLPVPDKVFVGGSGGNMDGIIKTLVALNPVIRIVANVIALQSLNHTLAAYNKYGLTNVEVVCVNIAKSKKINQYDLMIAQNPVYIITGQATSGGGSE